MNRMSRSVESPRVFNIEDLRRTAKRRLPRVVFDYIDGGAEDESTLRANCRAFEAVTFRPRCAVATPVCDLRTTVLGTSVTMPLILAPVGSCRLDVSARRRSSRARRWRSRNHLYAFDTFWVPARGRCGRIGGPVWYQLYLIGGRDCALGGIDRARRPGFRPWLSRSTRQSQVSGNATSEMARKNFLVENSDQCCRL